MNTYTHAQKQTCGQARTAWHTFGHLKVMEIQVSKQNEGTMTLCKIRNHSQRHIP